MFFGTGIEAIRSAITWKFDYESFPNGTKCEDFIYVCLKKIEEEGVGDVPTPQVRDSTNKFIYSAVFFWQLVKPTPQKTPFAIDIEPLKTQIFLLECKNNGYLPQQSIFALTETNPWETGNY